MERLTREVDWLASAGDSASCRFGEGKEALDGVAS
jgi:hypothetical protein